MPSHMTSQEVFDLVFRHFVIRGRPPGYERDMHGSWSCVLRTMEGDRCVLGLLLDDELDEYRLDNGNATSISIMIEWLPLLSDLHGTKARSFYRHLQEAHDQSCCYPAQLAGDETGEFHRRIEGRLRNVAFEFGLQVPLC